jgi:hypothetical protein
MTQRIQLSRNPSDESAWLGWSCPACGYSTKWLPLNQDLSIAAELVERDVELHEHEAHGIEAA